jgi:ribonucleoside-diphosphate reductase alpha chain
MPRRYTRRKSKKEKGRETTTSGRRYFYEMKNGTKLSGIRKQLFDDRYSMKDKSGKGVEKYPEQMWKRVAHAISRVEKTNKKREEWDRKFFEVMRDFKFNPAGRFLTSAGTGADNTMINCYVIPNPRDSRKGVIKTLEYVTEISARGGGVGFNLSTLRPRGSYLKTVNGTSSGSVSWSNLYSTAAHDIIQQGGTRRGALMMMLWDWHPDIEEFINVKKEQGKILGANLSVCVSDAFMEAVEKDSEWELKFPDTKHQKYNDVWDGDLAKWEAKKYPVKTYKKLGAKHLWDMICEAAWESAEPGVVFLDRYNKMNNTWYFEKNIATNPCGEQGLPGWGVCNLSSINLASLVKNGKFDFEEFKKLTMVGVRFLDDAIDAEEYLYKEIEDTQMNERRLGLGTMGLADALIKMKVRYGSDKSMKIIEKIYKTFRDAAYETSIELAMEKGSFPKFNATKFLRSGFARTLPKKVRSKIRKNGIRNAFLLTQAPTGKISLLAGVSSGIEPVFSFSYTQKDRLGQRMMYHSVYKRWIDENGEDDIPDYFVVADDLTPDEHVNIQALIQKYTDSSISKTVNAPKAHSVDDVKKLYKLAYESGCKGISYMREGSREATLVRNKEEDKEENKASNDAEEIKVWTRPVKIGGATYRLKTPVGTAYITVNHDEVGAPIELFINVGKAGSDVQAMAEALGRLISKTLKLGDNLSTRERAVHIIEQLRGIGGSRTVGFGDQKIASLPDAVAKALTIDMGLVARKPMDVGLSSNGNGSTGEQLSIEEEGKEEEGDKSQLTLIARKADLCPSCGNATLVNEMGCKTCHGCGYSEC